MSTCSIWLGNTLTPRMMSMSSVRPVTRSMRRNVRPQAHSPGTMREMSRVRYRMTGMPSLVSVVKTTSPVSPSGTGSQRLGIDDLDEEVVLVDVQPVLLEALGRHARARCTSDSP